MKLRKRKLFSSIAFVLSLVMLAVSGAVFVHTATQQSATSTLQVTYDGHNVNFDAAAWYQKPSNNARQAFTGNTLSVSATDAGSTTHTLSVTSPITLDATTDTYILFTYKFVNTASNDGYDMLVALTDNATKTNVNVKYYTSVTSGTSPSMYSTLSSQKDIVENNGIALIPAPISVPAQYSLLYYILVEIDDYTMGATYTGDNNHKITWTITSASTKGASTPAVTYDANGGVQQNNSTPTKEGYTFGGWNTSSDGTGTTYTNEQALALAQAGGQPIILYAKWEEVGTTIKVFCYNSSLYYYVGGSEPNGYHSNGGEPYIDLSGWTQIVPVNGSLSFQVQTGQNVFFASNEHKITQVFTYTNSDGSANYGVVGHEGTDYFGYNDLCAAYGLYTKLTIDNTSIYLAYHATNAG